MANHHDKIHVIVVEGRELISADLNGRSDPYCIITYANKTFQTHCANMTLHPVWSSCLFTFDRVAKHNTLNFVVWDNDFMRRHDFMGQASINLPERQPNEPHVGTMIDTWLDLKTDDKHPEYAEDKLNHPHKLGKIHVIIFDGINHPVPQEEAVGMSLYLFDGYKDNLRTGDCILYSGSEAISGFIKQTFDTPYSHCGIILRMPDPTYKGEGPAPIDVFVAEADWDDGDYMEHNTVYGIVINKFEDRMKAYSGNAIWHCPLREPLNPDEDVEVWKMVLDLKRSKVQYDLVQGLYMMIGMGASNKETKNAVFCSELVALAMKKVKRAPQELNSANADPYTVSKLECYDGQFPKKLLRYQVMVDQARVNKASTTEIADLLPIFMGNKSEEKN